MTRILHIESATQVCSVCISEDEDILVIRETHEPNSHSKLLTVYIEELLSELKIKVAELDAISVSLGPGSYTGLRIGASTAKGLAYGSDLPVIGLDTLQILANRMLQEPNLQDNKLNNEGFSMRPMIDARRMEVYTARYNQKLEILDKVNAVIIDENSFQPELQEQKTLFFGNGAAKCAEILDHPNALHVPDIEASSAYMPSLAMFKYIHQDFLNTAYFEPFYLKEFIATIPRNKVIPEQARRGKR